MGDVQEEKGNQVTQEFRAEFGQDSAYFHKVDVSQTSEVQGS